MSLSLWRFFLEELLTLWRRKSQPVDIQVAVPMPVLGLCDTLRKGSQKSRQQALLGSERQSSSTDASQSPCPCGLHWVPLFRFPSLVRKTVSHPRITHMVGRTNRKGFLRSWNWGGGRSATLSAAQRPLWGAAMQSSFTAMRYLPCVPPPGFSLGHGLVISCSHTLPTHKALIVIF